MMKGNMFPGLQTDRSAVDIYEEVISKLNLSEKATELTSAVETLCVRIDSLRENMVSS